MTTVSYAVSVIPAAHKQAINRLVAMIEGEDLTLSENLSRPANADGSYTDPDDLAADATHWYGGRYVDAQWLMIYQNLNTVLPAPDGGWPLMLGDEVMLTEADAVAAAAALVIQVTTGPFSWQMPQQTITAVCTALGIVPIEVIE
jgi:hypothetical protein